MSGGKRSHSKTISKGLELERFNHIGKEEASEGGGNPMKRGGELFSVESTAKT